MLGVSALLFLRIDASRPLVPEDEAVRIAA
jgi:hypothetical protein